MAGKSPYASPEERQAARLAAERRRRQALRANPQRQEELLEQRLQRIEAAERAARMPKPVDVQLYRAHGPFAPLFALQEAA